MQRNLLKNGFGDSKWKRWIFFGSDFFYRLMKQQLVHFSESKMWHSNA